MVEIIVIDDPAIERPAIEEIADGHGIAFTPTDQLLSFHSQRLTNPFLKIHHGTHPYHKGIPILLGSSRVHDVLEIRLNGDRWG